MRISDWSSDVCSSDLVENHRRAERDAERDREHREPEQLARSRMRDPVEHPRQDSPRDQEHEGAETDDLDQHKRRRLEQASARAKAPFVAAVEIVRASCTERVCSYV